MKNHMICAETISKPFYNGQRVVRVAIQYDTTVKADALKKEAFWVAERNITGVFAAGSPLAEAPDGGGSYVILELDPRDAAAKTVRPLHPDAPPPKPDPRGPRGLVSKREPLAVEVRQTADISAADLTVLPAGSRIVSSREYNELSDRFIRRSLEGKEYNLFVPEGYRGGEDKQYPLVLFVGDQSISGKDSRIPLEQGLGALCWTVPSFQEKHPCFVLAPVHDDEEPIANDLYDVTDQLDRVKRMCEAVIRDYPVDEGRIYTTGQSMGCMTSYELMYRYPGFFAAALCVSGHWDREKLVKCARRGQKLWTVLSERDDKGYVCALEVRELLDKEHVDYGWYEWDGRASLTVLNEAARKAAEDAHRFRISVYPGDSALRRGMEDEAPHGHPAGWYLTYRINALCQWLLEQEIT